MSASAKARKRGPLSEETKRKISEAQRGKIITPEQRAKMSASHKGVPLSETHRQNMVAALPRGDRHPGWKGDAVSYIGLHAWMLRHFTKIGVCEDCGATPEKTEWANVTGLYIRDRAQFRELCISCHRTLDNPKNKPK
jgi:hypothetical protein